jgi:hypothetical protein
LTTACAAPEVTIMIEASWAEVIEPSQYPRFRARPGTKTGDYSGTRGFMLHCTP